MKLFDLRGFKRQGVLYLSRQEMRGVRFSSKDRLLVTFLLNPSSSGFRSLAGRYSHNFIGFPLILFFIKDINNRNICQDKS